MPTPAHKQQREVRQYAEDAKTIFNAIDFLTDTINELTAYDGETHPSDEELAVMRETAKLMLSAQTPLSDLVANWEAANGIIYDNNGNRVGKAGAGKFER